MSFNANAQTAEYQCPPVGPDSGCCNVTNGTLITRLRKFRPQSLNGEQRHVFHLLAGKPSPHLDILLKAGARVLSAAAGIERIWL